MIQADRQERFAVHLPPQFVFVAIALCLIAVVPCLLIVQHAKSELQNAHRLSHKRLIVPMGFDGVEFSADEWIELRFRWEERFGPEPQQVGVITARWGLRSFDPL